MSASDHPQKFTLTAIIHKETNIKVPVEPKETVEHIPQLSGNIPVYEVIGEGLDYLQCPVCFPNAGKMEDNRRAPGA